MPVASAIASQQQFRHRQSVEASFCEVGKLGCQHDPASVCTLLKHCITDALGLQAMMRAPNLHMHT
jgi:hypothetical protein